VDNGAVLYDDGRNACDDDGIVIRWYYPWGGKEIPYSSIRSLQTRRLNGLRKWRLWGTGDFVHWWNLDRDRPRKRVVLEIDTGHRVRPMITPDDPERVERILAERVGR